MSDKASIKLEIEAKKRRLAELKAKREARKNASAASSSSSPARPKPASSSSSTSGLLSSIAGLVGDAPSGRLVTRADPANMGVKLQEPVNIDPVEKHTYDFGCQAELGTQLTGSAKEMEKQLGDEKMKLAEQEEKLKTLMEQVKIDKLKYDNIREDERLRESAQLSQTERAQIQESKEFQDFFGSASRVMERALSSSREYNFMVDYSLGGDDDRKDDSGLAMHAVMRDDKRCGFRAVTSVNFSPKFPELLLATYAGHEDSMSMEPDGTVMVWNLHLATRPEYYFYCNSEVLAAEFHPSNPKLIVGACASGQVVIWDTREKSGPVNRTSLSRGHTYPVYAMQCVPLVGSALGKLHNIVTVSTDGHLCVWGDNNLHDPSSEIVLQNNKSKEEITTTSFDFEARDTGNILLGSDEGVVYKARVYDREGIYDQLQAHDAPITNLQFHPSHKHNASSYSDLYLTSSYDWTVKLWNNKTQRPLFTFDSARDYVFDVQWSPVHPAVFAQGDGTGKLDIWNLNHATDEPEASFIIDSPSQTGERGAISRIKWSEDGKHIAVGMSTGTLHIIKVRDSLGQPDPDDSALFFDKMHKKSLSTS